MSSGDGGGGVVGTRKHNILRHIGTFRMANLAQARADVTKARTTGQTSQPLPYTECGLGTFFVRVCYVMYAYSCALLGSVVLHECRIVLYVVRSTGD